MRLRVITLLAATSLLLVACGSDSEDRASDDAPATTAASSEEFDPELCKAFDESDGPTDELLAGLPEQHASAGQTIKDFGESMDRMDDNGDGGEIGAAELLAPILEDGAAEELADFAEFVERECGDTEATGPIAGVATAAEMLTEPEDDEYCAALRDGFGEASSGPEGIAAIAEVAPASHVESLESLSRLSDINDADADALFGPMFGIGGYAEVRCDIDGALVQMLLGAMFAGMDDSDFDSDDVTTTTVDPSSISVADATSANAAVPAGGDLEFEVRPVDLEDDGEYLASVVVPVGWEQESTMGLSFSPPSGSGASIFTTVDIDAGCDGMCEANDWEERLRGENGYLTSYLDAHDGATETPVSGSEGVVVRAGDEPSAVVLRWDDGVDKYFKCEVSLDEDDAALFDAFVAACEAARPGWFAVS